MTRPPRWACHACGTTFTAWAAAERHADETGHHRLVVIIDTDKPSPNRRKP